MVGSPEVDEKQVRLLFTSTASPSKSSETNVLLLAESIRAFAGSLSKSPIWYLVPDYGGELSDIAKDRLKALNVTLIPIKTNLEVLHFPFAAELLAAASVESMAQGKTELLVWLGANTVVLQEPKDFLLRDGKKLGYRPVHVALVGSRYHEPLDAFWTLIYHHCNVPESNVFLMNTHVEGTPIRPYFNAGLLVTRPEGHLLQTWSDKFFGIYQEPSFREFYNLDERYVVFMHQAVLAGVILSAFARSELQELPPTYNYPLHLYGEDVTEHRPSSLEELVTFRHEGFYEDPRWRRKMPAKEPLKRWLAERLF
jgi:hypothetical protein